MIFYISRKKRYIIPTSLLINVSKHSHKRVCTMLCVFAVILHKRSDDHISKGAKGKRSQYIYMSPDNFFLIPLMDRLKISLKTGSTRTVLFIIVICSM